MVDLTSHKITTHDRAVSQCFARKLPTTREAEKGAESSSASSSVFLER